MVVLAKKETILCAGAIDSPRLLLLSGIGPSADLNGIGIPVIEDIDGVGKSFTDHPNCVMCFHMEPGFSERVKISNPASFGRSQSQWESDRTGPLAGYFTSVPHAYLKNYEAYKTTEFQELPQETQDLLLKPEVPSFELVVRAHLSPSLPWIVANKQ